MAFYGHVIKALIETKHALLPHEPGDPGSAQETQLRELLDTAQGYRLR